MIYNRPSLQSAERAQTMGVAHLRWAEGVLSFFCPPFVRVLEPSGTVFKRFRASKVRLDPTTDVRLPWAPQVSYVH